MNLTIVKVHLVSHNFVQFWCFETDSNVGKNEALDEIYTNGDSQDSPLVIDEEENTQGLYEQSFKCFI